MTLHLTNLTRDVELDSLIVQPAIAPQKGSILYRDFVKRALDVALILMSAVIVVPVVALFALLVATDGHAPFYSQERVGKDGKPFRIWKLRTMVPNAHGLLTQYLDRNPMAKIEWDVTQKLKHDPRVTRVGWFLRKTSLDELPQLYNVLRGDMSLVGPRPMMLDQRSIYHGQAYVRLRPGITGPWQISDRNECGFLERVRFDETYDREVSFFYDVSILMRTVAVVLRGTGY